jgi:hypothetical protein
MSTQFSGSADWFADRDELATDILGVLQAYSLVPATRENSTERLERWIESHTSGIRDAVCKHWCAQQSTGVSRAELAALIADSLVQLNHMFPAATLSVYIVRFSGERICRSWSDNSVHEAPDR